jgi:hypothetical protein
MSVNDPCECGQTTIRGCADMPSRYCGAWEETTPPTFTAHELSALAEQGMTLTEAEEATVREARGQNAQPVTDIDRLIAEMRAGLEGVTPGEWEYYPHKEGDWRKPESPAAMVNETGDKVIDCTWASATEEGQRTYKHIARCSPANIAALLDEIERLRADNARLQTAVNSIASQKKYAEHGEDELRNASFEDAFDTCVDVARKAALFHLRTAMEASNGK